MTAMEQQDFTLDPDCELRFEVEGKKNVSLVLVSGKGEIFGTELAPNKTYNFSSGSKVAVFTWKGCTLKLSGNTEGTYIARETPMVMYLNTHACLERLRLLADEKLHRNENSRGPAVMVVGPTDVGKSSLCKILLNYAVRRGRRPLYVDLDIGQGVIGVPGSLGSILVERTASVEEGFSQEAPLVYSFGHLEPNKNMTLYNILVSKMAETVQEKMASNRKVAASGVIINTFGWVVNEGYKILTHIAQAFEVDVIIVLDQERLYNELVRDIPFIRVVFLPKSGGVVVRNTNTRRTSRDNRVREYFYGNKTKYHPHQFEVPYQYLKIYKIGSPVLPDSCLPFDMKVDDNMTKLIEVEPGPKLKHSILAVSMATEVDDIITSNVAGFICILDINEVNQTVTVLSPQPKPLPKSILIQTSVLFMDAN